ncbi:MAG: ADOP family duplicated permease [Vicinamibacterales bacterium]
MSAAPGRGERGERGERFYRGLLRVFPPAFRARHADEMTAVFRRQRARAAGRPLAIAALWGRAVRDAVTQGLALRAGRTGVTAGRRAGRTGVATGTPAGAGRQGASWHPVADIRVAVRGLRAAPVPTLVVLVALGLGLGGNAALATVAYDLLIDPLPYPHADRIVQPWKMRPSMRGLALSPSESDLDRWQDAPGIDTLVRFEPVRVTLLDATGPVLVDAARIEPALLDFAGAPVELGRPFTDEDARGAVAAPVALVSHALWQVRFGGAPDVLGRTIELDEVRHTIVGVLPPRFRLTHQRPDVVVPLATAPVRPDGSRAPRAVSALIRLAPGATAAGVGPVLTSRLERPDDWSVVLRATSEMIGPLREAVLVLLAAVACVLLIACANVAHVLLARNVGRRRELAVRAALGATRARLFAQVLTEHVVLSIAAGVVGAGLAWAALEGLALWRPAELQALAFVEVRPLTVAISLGLSIVAGLAVGLLPAWMAARSAVASRRVDGTRTTGDARSRWVRRGLNVVEVAAALVLLLAASLLVRTYVQLSHRDLGFAPAGVVALDVRLLPSRYPTPAAQDAFITALAAGLRAQPGVTDVSAAALVPPRGGVFFSALEIEGRGEAVQTQFDGGTVAPGFFRTLGIPIREGRAFDEADVREERPVVVVSQGTARRFWPDGDAIGRRLRLGPKDPWSTVVGVAGDVTSSSSGLDQPQFYLPLVAGQTPGAPTVVVRTTGSTEALVTAARGLVAGIDDHVAITSIRTLDADVAATNVRPRFNALLLGLLAGLGLILAVTGVFGVVNHAVGLRTRELGVRLALGASPAALGRQVIGEALAVGLAGVAAGVALWPLASDGLGTMLHGLAAVDGTQLGAAAVVLLAATAAAAWLPARRAMRVDPVVAMRTE